MIKKASKTDSAFAMPADLDSVGVVAKREELLMHIIALSQIDKALCIELTDDKPVSPLSLQLLASAARSRSAAQITFGERAREALSVNGSVKDH